MKYEAILNYLGQVRIYSFLDLIIFGTALTKNLGSVIGISFLWLGFLLYLESRHNDEGRLRINRYSWVGPFIFSFFLIPIWICLVFALLSYFYTNKKKNRFWGGSAPLWRALQNVAIAIGFNPHIAILVFILIFIRNLIADFRDVHDDKHRGIKTIPVLLGVKENQAWAFYIHLFLVISTTMIWFNYSFLDIHLLLPIIILELVSYPLTPRLSNPEYLNIYK